ncbi:hypothetical protein AVEN_255983-1 [Araneus ventricosus]|uniref:Uncharacterized protein n=1 Tax=Araneus ventricosus TaxID=182803 RepID=A0A4Y2Q0V2_ARAVE|nr:hypothetical protein AVEN_255983-1 [Araneus ventricosus]
MAETLFSHVFGGQNQEAEFQIGLFLYKGMILVKESPNFDPKSPKSLVITSSFSEDNQPTKIDLSHLNRLTDLDLSFNAITEVSDDWFARGPTSLTALVLSNNGIEKIGDRAFANLVNLDQLWLDGNRFGPIKRSMLPRPAKRLENLELDNNAFTSIADDLFTDMPALKDLSIRTNGIAHLPERAFKPIWSQLDVFDARDCDKTSHSSEPGIELAFIDLEGKSNNHHTGRGYTRWNRWFMKSFPTTIFAGMVSETVCEEMLLWTAYGK